MVGQNRKPRRKRRWDIGRLVARVLCAIFALIGTLPLLGGLLVRSEPVLSWAASETARVLKEQLGLQARYRVEMRLWPLQVSMHDLEVPSVGGKDAALTAARIAVTPRVFSLLAGRLDVGDIEIDAPRGRLVIRDGEITNVAYRLPERRGPEPELTRAPFSSLAVTDAVFDLDVEGVLVRTGPFDLDVLAGWGPSFEIALRMAETTIERSRKVQLGGKSQDPKAAAVNKTGSPDQLTLTAVDEDVVCGLDLRARVEPQSILVRRLSLLGVADSDPRRGTRPACQPGDAANEDDPARVELRLSQLRIQQREGQVPMVAGHIVARAPVGLANRFVQMGKLRGWVGLVADVRHDGRSRLPQAQGKLRGGGIQLEGYRLGKRLETEFQVANDQIRLPRFEVEIADGKTVATNVVIKPFEPGVPLQSGRIDITGVQFPGLMRDVDVTDNTVVAWDLNRVRVKSFGGTLDPLKLDGPVHAETRDFEVFDRSVHDPNRRHMIGVPAALVRARLGVRPHAFEIYDAHVTFGQSALLARLVSIGYDNKIRVEVEKSPLDLSDITPLVDIPWAGQAEVSVTMAGQSGDPLLTGELAIQDFVFGGFPIGEVHTSNVRFRPLKVDFLDVRGRKGRTNFVVPTARLDFDTAASLLVDATVESERMDVRDFFAMFHFDTDPRFDAIHGTGAVQARVHYDLGGPQDRCGGGYLRVRGDLNLHGADLLEERFDSGHANFDFRWVDRDASYLGIDLDVPSVALRKGSGTVLGSVTIRQGALLSGNVVATGIPSSEIQSLGTLGMMLDAKASAVAEIGGSIDELSVDAHVNISRTRIGGSTLPASQLYVGLKPTVRKLNSVGTTHCARPVPAEFDRAEYDRDRVLGVFHVSGSLFGQQVQLQDLKVTRQRAKHVSGDVALVRLDIGALAELAPDAALPATRPRGHLTAKVRLDDLPTGDPYAAKASVTVTELAVRRDGLRVELLPGARTIVMDNHRLQAPGLALAVDTSGGPKGVIDARATVDQIGRGAQVDATLELRPVELSALAGLLPRLQRASGELRGEVRVTGPVRGPSYNGGFVVDRGQLTIRGLSAPVTDLELELGIDNSELRIRKGSARIGNGTVQVSGTAPFRGLQLGKARGVITARSLSFTLTKGVKTTFDADLIATWEPSTGDGTAERSLPRVTGDVTLRSFEYTRPITMSADISSLAQKGKRTAFESYDPADDSLEFDVTVKSNQPLKINNNLVSAKLEIAKEGLNLAGTNQRFGMRGTLRVKPGGRFQLRRNEFEMQHGHVRFDDLTRIAPQVDVTATTEYRRYSESLAEPAAGQDSTASGTAASAAGGQWHIVMHAYGDADKLRIDLTSQPALPRDDIFLLLTVGLTRAELDQARSASVGESVALEALGTLSGADKAVTDAVPVIDDFRFGSAYSSRTGRTEPTVTIGKRLADRIRANVTSGLTDSREVRSNVEWRLSRRVSVEGSYDNVNDISSSSLGNLGADIRWRLEFR